MQLTKTIDGIEFRQSPTWPTLYASACGLICYPSGKVSRGSIDSVSGYYKAQWRPILGGKQHYAKAHRVIADAWLGLANGLQVDHLNGIKTHNAIANLRYATIRENAQNKRKHREGFGSAGGFVGCYEVKPWNATIWVNGKCQRLGAYDTVEEAAAAYDAALISLGLEPVNFPIN